MFYLTLPSNSSMTFFPNNTVGHYTTQLPQAIRLTGEWECGLVELHYTHSWFNIQTDEVYIDISPAKKSSFNWTPRRLTLPAGYYATPKSLAQGLNEVMNTTLVQLDGVKNALTFTFDDTRQVFQMICHKEVRIEFSPRLNQLLGLGVEPMITVPSTTPHVGIVNRQEIPDSGLQALYVYCDVVESRVVGDTLAPLLQSVNLDRRNIGLQVCREFQHIQYVNVQKKEFTTVEIDIRDDYGRAVPFQRGKVIATLHFRRKRASHFT